MDKIQELRESVQKVYDSGHDEGYSGAINRAVEIQEEFLTDKPKPYYDIFWDTFQNNGARVNYGCGFGGLGWTDNLFNPKYDIFPTDGYMMFRGTGITDIKNIPVKLDFSNCTNFQYMFQWASVKHIGILDTRKATNLNNPFYYATALVTIDKLILKDDGAQNMGVDTFGSCNALQNITIEGKFGKTLSFGQSTKLSKASIESIINALSTTTSGLTVTLSQTAVNKAFETVEGAADGSTSAEWIALAGDETTDGIRPKWNISLV